MKEHPVKSDRSVSRPAPRNKAPPPAGGTSRGVKLGACVLAVIACWAFWAAPRAGASPRARADRLSESPLVLPWVQALDGGQQALDQRQVQLSSPEEVLAREASQTEYEGLSAERAAQVLSEAFPQLVTAPAGGPPRLPAGQRITGYPSADAAQVDLGGGRGAVIASTEPMAIPSSSGGLVPIDLALTDVGGAFEPATPAVRVSASKRLADGVVLSGVGVSLTPLGEGGVVVAGSEGTVDGATVFYGNTGVDTDTVVKPVASGFELDTILRSVQSPDGFTFRVGLPAGAKLAQAEEGSVDVVDNNGNVVARVEAPFAEDADHVQVPVSMSFSEDVLRVSVDAGGGSYRDPIRVDPTVKEGGSILFNKPFQGTWGFSTAYPEHFSGFSFETLNEGGSFERGVKDEGTGIVAGQSGGFSYATQGESRIYEIIAETSSNAVGSSEEDVLGIENIHSGTTEASKNWLGWHGGSETVCVLPACATGTVEHNVNDSSEAFFEQSARESSYSFTSKMLTAYEYILQEASPKASFDTTDEKIGGANNAMYAGRWIRTNNLMTDDAFVNSYDPGLGISEMRWSAPEVSGWGGAFNELLFGCTGVQCNECFEISCGTNPWGVYLGGLPDGEDALEVTLKNPVGLTATAKGTVKMDNTAPYGLTLAGLPPGNEIGYGPYRVKASATDGAGKTASSGVASIALAVDGKEVGKPSGSCPLGPCKATGEWTINGEEYVAGKHTITVTATDGAGNQVKEDFTLVIHSAESSPVGPGSVELDSGALTLRATDVAITSPLAGLEVQRSYNSRTTGVGVKGPLGPQWSGLSLAGSESLKELPTGSMVLTAASGQESLFVLEGSKFVSPTGDKNLTLSKEAAGQFSLKDQHGNITVFTVPSGGSGTTLTPSRREEAGGTRAVTFSFQTAEGVTEPTQALAPVAAGVKCATLVIGCRALTFSYAKATIATGEDPEEWGEYAGHLSSIAVTAWSPKGKEMTTTTVAQYTYDGQGRLRAEWDPRISPALKTTYGYDAEGHVTSVTPPGQQPWLFTYGMLNGDTHGGRLLTVVRPSASTPFGNGEAPKNTAVPTLSAKSLGVGVKLTVSTGTWSNSPLAYSYQWQECNPSGNECMPILGATNPGYMTRYVNEGHTLVAEVTATNAAGTVTTTTAPTNEIPVTLPTPTYHSQIHGEDANQLKAPSGIAVFDHEIYVTDTADDCVNVFETNGTYLRKFGSAGEGNGQFKEPTGIAIDERGGYVFVADSGNKRVEEFSTFGTFLHAATTPGRPSGVALTSEGVYATDTTNSWIDEIYRWNGIAYFGHVTSEGSGEGQFKDPTGITYHGGDLYVSDSGNDRVQQLTLDGKYLSQFGAQGKANGQLKAPTGIAVGPAGGIWVVDSGNNRVEKFTNQGKYLLQFGGQGKATGQFNDPQGLAVPEENEPYAADTGNGRTEQFLPGKAPAELAVPAATPPKPGTSAVTTIEYQIPISGAGAPYALGSTEAAAWAQKDDPIEATALYPPDEPMGWPAQDYRRATIYYRDNRDCTVNVASPGGGISTAEYNTNNDIERTLTPDNRQAALAEGAKSAEAAQLLDTKSAYNSEGTEVEETVGPQHLVKLASGSETIARRRTHYFYDEGAPKTGGPYGLVTKTTVGAQFGKGEEADVHTSVTQYSGQNNLGWKLRRPTAVITDPGGLKITKSTAYDPNTGNITETLMPAGAESTELPVFNSKFGSFGSKEVRFEAPWGIAVEPKGGDVYVSDYTAGHIVKTTAAGSFVSTIASKGSGEGQVKDPEAITVSSAGNLYVGDMGNHRIDEFSANGKYLGAFGNPGSGEGQFSSNIGGLATDTSGDVWVSDTNDNRVDEFNSQGKYVRGIGKEGSGAGQFYAPMGLTISGGNLYIADFNNNRIQEFNLEGKYLGQFGSWGAENGQLKEPWAITADANGDLYVSDRGPDRVQEFSSAGKFLAWLGAYGAGEGQFNDPDGLATNSSGTLYVVDSGNYRVDEWTPGNQGAHATQTIYYTAESKSPVPACANHPEWANLPCQTQPAAQPETPSLPNLPVTTFTYNIWDEPETATETVEGTARTKTQTYDAAGRLATNTTNSKIGTALPTTTHEYNSKTGQPAIESTTTEGKTLKIEGAYNTLGQLTAYTDADGNTSAYTYDINGRPETINDGKGTQTYSYDSTTGQLVSLKDSAAGTFTAGYDTEGNLLAKGYPNGMKANYTYNQTAQPTSLEYIKTTHCPGKCTWFKETTIPSITGQTLNQASSLSTKSYTYDNAARLIQVQSTPAGGTNCTTRAYAYDPDTNRTSLSTRTPGSEGKCATEGGSTETHDYDTADRLTDTAITYDTWGNILTLPTSDAGGSELLSTYYTDNQLASQTQNGQTISYQLDPAGRPRETISTGKSISTMTDHYAGAGPDPAWTTNTSGEWTRNIQGIDGQLAAVQSNSETPVLQLSNLHGDIIATAYLSETAGGLASSADTTEYGVPTTSLPPKYSWLGALQLPTELPSGVVAMGARSYVPQIGRFLQDDPIPGGSANAYTYTYGDPINTSDPTGAYTYAGPSASRIANMEKRAAAAAAEQAAINAAARAAAEAAAREAQGLAGPMFPGGEEPWEEWEESEEEGEEGNEYIAYNHPASPESSEPHIEEAILYQPLDGEGSADESITRPGSANPLCTSMEGPCTQYVKGGPGATCGSNSPTHRSCHHHHRGGGGGPSIEEEISKAIGEVICGVSEIAQISAEQTTVGKAMIEEGRKPKHCNG